MWPLGQLLAAAAAALVTTTQRLDAATTHPLLGKRALLVSGVLPFDVAAALEPADAVLSAGASCTILVPLPRSGAAASDDAALRLLLRINRIGWPALMESLGFSWGVGLYGTGNRPRVSVQQVRADDVEAFALALSDADLILVHTLAGRRELGAPTLVPADLAAPRFAMLRGTFSFFLRRLRQNGRPLLRDTRHAGVHWAWLAQQRPPPADDSAEDGCD